MERSIHDELLALAASAEPIAEKLRKIDNRTWPVAFSHVIESAQAFLVATIARKIDKTLWVLCPSARSQELFYEGLVNWLPDAQFLPEAEFAAVENILPDPEIAAERLALLSLIEREPGPHVIVATRASLDQAAPQTRRASIRIASTRAGKNCLAWKNLLESFRPAGYERVAQVTTRGQFAVRGGIVDLYSWQATLPVRVEFFGDDVESLREFDIDTQTSVRDLRSIDILLGAAEDQSGKVRDYIGKDHLKIDIAPEEDSDAQIQISEGWIESGPEDFSGAFQDCDVGEFAVGEFMLAEAKRAQFIKQLNDWRKNKARVVIYFQTEGEIERFREIMSAADGALDDVDLVEGTLARGFCFPAANLVVLSAAELFGRFAAHARRRLRRAERHRAQIDFSELNEGDYVVHLEHGVGRFLAIDSRSACRPAANRKFCSRIARTRRNFTSRSNRPISSRVTSASARNLRRSVRWATRSGRARSATRPRRFSITPGKCSRCKRSAKRSPVTRLDPTQNGRWNSSIRFRFAKRPTR